MNLFKNDPDFEINDQTFRINIKEEKINQEDNVFLENYFTITPENLSHSNNNENSNVNSFSDLDNEILTQQKLVNYNKSFHELY